MKIKDIQDAIQEIKEFWEDKVKPTVDNCKKLIKTATKARKTGETADKANTLAMSLNPVAAAIQYATKLLLDLLRSEINALFDVVSVVTPARDEFINFSGGTNSSGITVKGSFNTKVEQMEVRIRKRKEARLKRKNKLKNRIQKRIDEATAREKAIEDEKLRLAKEIGGEPVEEKPEGSE